MKKIIIISLATLAGWGILFLLAAKQSQELDSMDEFEFWDDEGSDIDAWEEEQVFQDHEGDDEALELESCEGWEDDRFDDDIWEDRPDE